MDPAFLTRTELPVQFGRYRLTALLGEGGMGKVFRAELVGPAGFRKELALKVLRDTAVGVGRADFVREARLGGLLKHPNLVDVYELDEIDGRLVLVMEYVRGVALSSALRELATLPAAAALQVARQICVALAHAHGLRVEGRAAGLVHSDLKPANVILGRDGLVKVLDLGVAWAAGLFGERPDGQLRGTISWMAPEQLQGQAVDHRADLFALGDLLAVMCLGHHPFRRATLPATAAAIIAADASVAEIGLQAQLDAVLPGLGGVVCRCLRADPAGRPPTAGALAADLARLQATLPPGPALAGLLGDLLPNLQTDQLVGEMGSSRAGSSTQGGLLEPGVPRTNVDAPRDAFFGRDDEQARIGALFDGGVRLVTLKATGGAGKTRLAQRFASGRAVTLPGGAWFVSLAEARSAVGIVHAIADALGLRQGDDPGADLAAALADREATLLVLDNAEHLVQHLAPLVRGWLASASRLQLLITSRRPLGQPGEQVLELGALDPSHGVALFRERAVRANPGWEPSEDDLGQLPELVRRLDGLPLAIELAAARVGALPVRELLARLGQRFKLLQAPDAGDARRATMAGTLAWSWEQLTGWEQAALSQLTTFVGGFSLDEAEQQLDLEEFVDAPWAVDVVGSLLRQSMLTSQSVEGRSRYAMYETIRDFAAAALTAEERAEAELRHARAFARLGRADAFDALDRRGGGTLRRRLVRELENLVVATERAIEAEEPNTAAACAIAALEALDLAGPVVVAETLAQRVLSMEGIRPELSVRLLIGSAWSRRRTSFRSAQRRLDRAMAQARAAKLRDLELRARLMHGGLSQGNANDAGLARTFDELAWEFEDRGDFVHSGRARAWKGSVLYHQGRLDDARVEFDEALALLRDHAGRRDELHVRTDLGMLLIGQGRLEEADAQHAICLKLARATGDRFREGVILGNLGVSAMARQDAARAEEFLVRSARIHREVGARAQEGICLLNLGQIRADGGDLRRARRYLARGMDLCRRTWPLGSGAAASMLAVVAAREGKHAEAARLWAEGRQLLAEGVDRVEEGKLLARGALLAFLQGDAATAEERLAAARAAAQEVGAGAESDMAQLIEAIADEIAG